MSYSVRQQKMHNELLKNNKKTSFETRKAGGEESTSDQDSRDTECPRRDQVAHATSIVASHSHSPCRSHCSPLRPLLFVRHTHTQMQSTTTLCAYLLIAMSMSMVMRWLLMLSPKSLSMMTLAVVDTVLVLLCNKRIKSIKENETTKAVGYCYHRTLLQLILDSLLRIVCSCMDKNHKKEKLKIHQSLLERTRSLQRAQSVIELCSERHRRNAEKKYKNV
jgi:uncharacterized membrane protein